MVVDVKCIHERRCKFFSHAAEMKNKTIWNSSYVKETRAGSTY